VNPNSTMISGRIQLTFASILLLGVICVVDARGADSTVPPAEVANAEHWAYTTPEEPSVPAVMDADWASNWIDLFLLARLDSEGLAPSPPADPATLIRRLHLDLTGLPPPPDRVDVFVADTRPDAYVKLVDQLLALPSYGERMAMYWLDLVRYADTVGYHGDQDHSISPYRDFVIDALNENMAFDEFTRMQLAGDLITDAGVRGQIASGYNRLLQTSHEGGVQKQEYLAIYGADRVRNVSTVWLGATLGCCQCHDHKYDPLTLRDFYSMKAFFADIDEEDHFRHGTDALPTNREPELSVFTEAEGRRVDELEQRIENLDSSVQSVSTEDRELIVGQIEVLKEERASIEKNARKTMISRAVTPRMTRILPRGNWLDESGEIVEPAVPARLGKLELGRRATRLDLANWLTSLDGVGALTARVMVNRLWYLFFGVGIAGSLDDFGAQGEAPVHPELLDALALEFLESGWDLKHTVKLLVMSQAYRQSSLEPRKLLSRDPENRLVARQSRFRLSAETIRDNALALSGLLVSVVGGSSAKPYQPTGYYQHLNFPARTYKHHGDLRQWRRGVYVHWQRQFLHPMLKAFDAPTREECTTQRSRSNTPLAALTLLNDPTFVEAARALAECVLREESTNDRDRLDGLFQRVLLRRPDDRERDTLLRYLDTSRVHYRKHEEDARALVSTGQLRVADDLDAVELASWTAVARALLNLHETVMRT